MFLKLGFQRLESFDIELRTHDGPDGEFFLVAREGLEKAHPRKRPHGGLPAPALLRRVGFHFQEDFDEIDDLVHRYYHGGVFQARGFALEQFLADDGTDDRDFERVLIASKNLRQIEGRVFLANPGEESITVRLIQVEGRSHLGKVFFDVLPMRGQSGPQIGVLTVDGAFEYRDFHRC
ncbi:MAG: hypothetical protein Q8N18_18925 [Opitutaceae bacterium]|nr:hypothetical protein [Opitutaceae bacterium]